jgi:hypothetical protein
MKKTTKEVIEKFPMLKDKLNDYQNLFLTENSMKGLDEVESTFLRLAWFFEEPESESFDLRMLHQNLDNDWLEFALELVTRYFREDTFLIQKPSYTLIKEDDGSNFFSLSQFADYLKREGLRYDRQKLNVYYKRGKVPEPDVVIGGVRYWSKSSVVLYGEKEKERAK